MALCDDSSTLRLDCRTKRYAKGGPSTISLVCSIIGSYNVSVSFALSLVRGSAVDGVCTSTSLNLVAADSKNESGTKDWRA
jgi:hypothetical protein